MVNSPQAYQEWLRVVIKKMSHLSKSQAVGLAMWSFAIAMTHSCGLSTVTVKGSWKPYWLELLKQIEDGIPDDWLVIVTTDRGLSASWLYEAIVKLGWHPLMRINHQGYYQAAHHQTFRPLSTLITQVGQHWSGQVTCFTTNSIDCTLLASWEEGYADPWLMLTDLTPQQAQICWYSMRSWIECLFKDIKRGGLGWHQTKMTDPKRAERLWLAIAVATLWLVSVGGQINTDLSASSLSLENETVEPESIESMVGSNLESTASDLNQPTRYLSCFRRGFLVLLASVIKQLPLPKGRFVPQFSLASG